MTNKKHQNSDSDINDNSLAQRLLSRYVKNPGLISRSKIDSLINRYTYTYSPLLLRLQRWTNVTANPQVLRTSSRYVYSKSAHAEKMLQSENVLRSFAEYNPSGAGSSGFSPAHSEGVHIAKSLPGAPRNNASYSGKVESTSQQSLTQLSGASGRGAIKRSEPGNVYKPQRINTIPNTPAAKSVKTREHIASKVALNTLTDARGGLLSRKFKQKEGYVVQAQKTQTSEFFSPDASGNTGLSTNHPGNQPESPFIEKVNKLESHPKTTELVSQLPSQSNPISNKPIPPHTLHANAGSVRGHEFVSGKIRAIKHEKLSRKIGSTKFNHISTIDKASKLPESDVSATAAQGDRVSAKKVLDIQSQPLPSSLSSSSTAKKITEPSAKYQPMVRAVVQRKIGAERTSQSLHQTLPLTPSMDTDKNLNQSRSDTVGAADQVRHKNFDNADTGMTSNSINTPTRIARSVVKEQIYSRVTDTNTTMRKQTYPQVLVSRGVVQRSSRPGKNTSNNKSTTNINTNKLDEPKTVKTQYPILPKYNFGPRSVQTSTSTVGAGLNVQMPLTRHVSVVGNSLDSYNKASTSNSFEPSRVVSADQLGDTPATLHLTPGKHNAQRINSAPIRSTHKLDTPVLIRTVKTDVVDRAQTKPNNVPTSAYKSSGGGELVSPAISVFTPKQSSVSETQSRSARQTILNTNDLPIVSRFKDQSRQEITGKLNASEEAVGTPLLRLNATHHRAVQPKRGNSSNTEASGYTLLQTANESTGGIISNHSPTSQGQFVSATSPAADTTTTTTTSTASQIMQLEQHELEFLAKQVYEIIEDRLELERESMGLM